MAKKPSHKADIEEQANTIHRAMAEPQSHEPSTDDAAFAAYWERLLSQSAALRSLSENSPVRGLILTDFRDAMRDAFLAGRASLL